VGRRKRDKNHSPSLPNSLKQDSKENEKNRYPVLESNKTKINDIKEPNDVHKNTLKEEILKVIAETFMEIVPDTVNQKVHDALKKFQDTKIENMRRHRNKSMN
jgi:hypothetical protein